MKINEIITERKYDPSSEKKLTKSEVAHKEWMASLEQQATWMGSNSKTWNPKTNKLALKMHKQGYNFKEIWALTQNIMGTDGQWRQEIDDSKSRLKSNPKGNTMGDHVDHPELYAAYPGIENTPFDSNWNNKGTRAAARVTYGDWDHKTKEYPPRIEIGDFDGQGRPVSSDSKLGSANHEWGHVIQSKYEKTFATGDNEGTALSKEVAKNNYPMTPLDAYLGKGGEHMTHASELRHYMTKQQRKDTPPDLSQNSLGGYADRVTIPGTKVPNFNTKYPQNLNPVISTTPGQQWSDGRVVPDVKHVTFDNPMSDLNLGYPNVTTNDIARIKKELKIKNATVPGPKSPAPKLRPKNLNKDVDSTGTKYGTDAAGNRFFIPSTGTGIDGGSN